MAYFAEVATKAESYGRQAPAPTFSPGERGSWGKITNPPPLSPLPPGEGKYWVNCRNIQSFHHRIYIKSQSAYVESYGGQEQIK